MTVTEAAKKLGVGRPALSNLLNGNSSLSPDMAVKMEKSFGAGRQNLLDLQAAFNLHKQRGKEKTVTAHRYVPPFLTIKARQIEDWAASNLEARHLLPVFLRKLVHSTGHELRRVDFPGYDNAERKGSDGIVEADAATPWIPEGKSCWEFGTNQRPREKAESDYAARLGSTPPAERSECTFVFVTPRNWHGKTDWAKSKNAEGEWKAVRAFDASDLEQWLEESIPARMWLAEQLNPPPTHGFDTLDRCWQDWADASEPKMVPKIFEPSITAYRNLFKSWLAKPSERPFVVTADSKDEALAFLSCLFQDGNIATSWGDLAIVFKSAEMLRTLANSSSPFIPIVCTEEAERELATVYRRFHCIIVRPRNAIDSRPDISLDLLNYETFKKGLAEMGIEDDGIERLARESGRSPTILRRRLSEIPAIRKPQWAGDAETARNLIPMTLIGAWDVKSSADCEIISTLADRPYKKQIERSVAHLLQFDDSPVWSTGQYRGVASKIDALFAVNKSVTANDLTEFFWLAEFVLSESDPALELPEEERWAASVYGKVRDHSAALREGICETLVILSVHGNNLFQERLGLDVEEHVSGLIRKLLTPISLDKLLSQGDDLPHYAEAAPEEFLSLIEADLKKDESVVLGLLKPVRSGFLDSPKRLGLLRALECLAWKHLGRVSLILARLSKIVINDNWTDKPISSLQDIYRSWFPQTAASLEERIQALEMLTRRFPDIAWQICLDQITTLPRVGSDSYRPRWRSDASDAGRPMPWKEFNEFNRKALDIMLAWPWHDQKTLSDLVRRLPALSDADQGAVWDLIDTWADSETDESAKALLCEQIRMSTLARGSRQRGVTDETKNRGRKAREKLQPQDIVTKHVWLFAHEGVDPSTDDTQDENLDYSQTEERRNQLRTVAMKEIWQENGFEGVRSLLSCSGAPNAVGRSLEPCIKDSQIRTDLLRKCLSITGEMERNFDDCIKGFLLSCTDEVRDAVLSSVVEGVDMDQAVRLFFCAPFKQDTWRMLDRYGKGTQDQYWRKVIPDWGQYNKSELIEIIDRLLESKRPLAAFSTVSFDWKKIETSRLKRLLFSIATVSEEPVDQYKLEPYYISEALRSLDSRTDVSLHEMAHLEFIFIEGIEHSEHGIPNLERQINESPTMFVQALALAFRRNDGGQDPPEWGIEDFKHRAPGVVSSAYRLLDRINRIPGTGLDGKVDTDTLLAWMMEVRQLCAEHGRSEVGDQKIGQLLSKAPVESSNVWPCLPVCEAMEKIASREIGRGFAIGVYNSRGVHSRGMDEGGDQERELAKKYRSWAKIRASDYPYVSSVLESIAHRYDRDAKEVDNRRKIEKRLRN